jgi:hypothetical protein
MEILVFTTSVQTRKDAELIAPALNSFIGKGKWNFALDDTDKILRIVSNEVSPVAAIQLLEKNGFRCKELED